jgi:hypothetical protein
MLNLYESTPKKDFQQDCPALGFFGVGFYKLWRNKQPIMK